MAWFGRPWKACAPKDQLRASFSFLLLYLRAKCAESGERGPAPATVLFSLFLFFLFLLALSAALPRHAQLYK